MPLNQHKKSSNPKENRDQGLGQAIYGKVLTQAYKRGKGKIPSYVFKLSFKTMRRHLSTAGFPKIKHPLSHRAERAGNASTIHESKHCCDFLLSDWPVFIKVPSVHYF